MGFLLEVRQVFRGFMLGTVLAMDVNVAAVFAAKRVITVHTRIRQFRSGHDKTKPYRTKCVKN